MKKTMLLVVAAVVLLVVSSVFAQDTEKVFTFIDIRNDFVSPKSGEDVIGQSAYMSWKYKNISALLETDYVSKYDSFTVKPSLIFSKGSWSILGGLSSNNKGADFAQAGIGYYGNFGKASVLADVRNYFSTTGQSNGYLDSFFRVMYPLTDKLSVGTDLIADYWWKDGNSWYLVGPRISYQLTERVGVYARLSNEWNILESGTDTTARARVGLTFSF